MNLLKHVLLATVLAAAGFIGDASAQATDEATFQVSITITESCEVISATAIEFGSVVRSTGADTTGTLTVNCSAGTTYNVALNGGENLEGTVITGTSRRMTNDTDFVAYGLYSDSVGGTVWGNDAASVVPGIGDGNDQPLTIYADVTGDATDVPGDTYLDTVTATITY